MFKQPIVEFFPNSQQKLLCTLLATALISPCFMPAVLALPPDVQDEVVQMQSSDIKGLAMTVHGRQLFVAAGEVTFKGKSITVDETTISIPECPPALYKAEPFTLAPETQDHKSSWKRTPLGTRSGGVGVSHLLITDSLLVYTVSLDAAGVSCKNTIPTTDYVVDPLWGIISSAGDLKTQTKEVLIDYAVRQRQIDTVVVGNDGSLNLICGPLSAFAPSPPHLPKDVFPIANILAPAFNTSLTEFNVMPIREFDRNISSPEENKEYLSKTIQKLKSGLPVKIAFCGDSVTCGGFATSKEKAFPALVLQQLHLEFPKSTLSDLNFCQNASNSSMRFSEFISTILPAHPDLIIVEFVNDLSLTPIEIEKNYSALMQATQKYGVETIVCLPHLPNPTYYSFSPQGWESVAGKPYYGIIRRLAKKYHFAIADISKRYELAYMEGLTPELLLSDGTNHPNDRGHEMYAEEIMRCLR